MARIDLVDLAHSYGGNDAPPESFALKPVTILEKQIRSRDPKDKSKLADSSDDRLLKPLLTAIDGVHERSEAAMRRALTMAYTDPVTRLPNRLRFMSKLETTVGAGNNTFLVICDLDKFRQVNVTYGPRVADLALATVAERLRASASQSQTSPFFIGRIGADQFGIIFPAGDRESVGKYIAAVEPLIADPMTAVGLFEISSEDIALIVQERGISSEKTRINVHSCTD